jgi:hypothetical protein
MSRTVGCTKVDIKDSVYTSINTCLVEPNAFASDEQRPMSALVCSDHEHETAQSSPFPFSPAQNEELTYYCGVGLTSVSLPKELSTKANGIDVVPSEISSTMPPQQVTPPVSATPAEVRELALAEPQSEKLFNRAVYASTAYETRATWRESLRGAAYVAWIMLGPFLDMVWVIIPTQLFLRSPYVAGTRAVWPQKLLQWLEKTYFAMLGGLLEVGGGMELVVTTGDKDTGQLSFTPEEHVLLLCNHRTEIDWIFFWYVRIETTSCSQVIATDTDRVLGTWRSASTAMAGSAS